MLRWVLAVLGALGSPVLHADSWSLPTEARFHSADEQWRLIVHPKRLESQLAYFTDKVAAEHDGRPVARDQDNHGRATLYRKGRFGMWRRAAAWRLVNEVSPVSALVANDGTVVTFDNWHSLGYGEDVIVIYRCDGTLVTQLGLDDLMEPYDVTRLRHSVSSIWWSGSHRIDELRRLVVVQVEAKRIEEFPISLETGNVLVAKRALFTPPRVTLKWRGHDEQPLRCGNASPLAADELQQHALTTAVPEYPVIARKAHIAGTVIVEIMIDERGLVTDAVVLKPLPFGIAEASRDAVLRWTFRPFAQNGSAVPCSIQVKFTFAMD